MSETSETKGRCRREMAAAFEGTGFTANKEIWLLADGIDRLAAELDDVKEMVREIALQAPSEFGRDACDRIAADVAAVKEATLPQTTEERDCAIRERDEAKAEVERLKAELAAAQAETQRIQDEADDREETERVKRLKAEIEKTHRALLNRTCERDEAKADAERLYAELAARPAAVVGSETTQIGSWIVPWILRRNDAKGSVWDGKNCPACGGNGRIWFKRFSDWTCICSRQGAESWWTGDGTTDASWLDELVFRWNADKAARPTANSPEIPDSSKPAAAVWLTEVERRILAAHVKSLREQRFAMERGGLSIGYSTNPGALKHDANAIDAILARAGSPPVVEVPVMHAGGIHEVIHSQYRAALDKAGVQWKEAPRE